MVASPGATAAASVAAVPAHVAWQERLTKGIARYGVLIGFLASIAVFGILRSETFLTVDNAKSILVLAAPLAIVAVGLTAVLVMGDFDLSFASLVGLSGVVAVILMVQHDWQWPAAVAAALAAGAAGGLVNGLLVARFGAPSFIATLAMGTVFTGVEYQVSKQATIFGEVPPTYAELSRAQVAFGIPAQVWWALAVAIVLWVVLQRTEMGRYMYATGSSREAAELSGLAVLRLRIVGFVIVGLAAGIAGVLLTAQATASSPNQGAPLLLPAFAAAFIGAAMSKHRQFNVWGTVIGVLFLQVMATGLTMLALTTAQVYMAQGAILVGAILLSLVGRNSE